MMAMSEFAVELIVVRAHDVDIVSLHGPGFEQVEPLALGNALHYVHQDDIGEFLIRDAQCAIGAHVSGAHNRDFLSQGKLLFLEWKTEVRMRGLSELGAERAVAPKPPSSGF